MMNEIILNGVSSFDLQGLIIQTLPPISKPKIRTQIEEIDGRDGDIVTPLGFSAYDKTFDIGLSFGYDIDDIIAFFSSKGTVVFSNEGGKYYNYQILQQIDFEKLIRFKTATVTMHVQPFKYSSVEVMKTFSTGLITLNNYSRELNGLLLTATNEIITISGTPTENTELYVPINLLALDKGSYTLNAYSRGTSPGSCSVRVIYNSPSDENSFGKAYITLQDDTTVTLSSILREPKTYNYIYFYITAGSTVNFTLNLSLIKNGSTDLVIRNTGNYISKPTMTIYGSGTINFSLNGNNFYFGNYNTLSKTVTWNKIFTSYSGCQVPIENGGTGASNVSVARTNLDVYSKSEILDVIYPVGAIYMSVNSANPQTLFGGSWEQIQDRFLLAAGSAYSAGSTGGESTHTHTTGDHTLTIDEIPSHTHGYRDANDDSSTDIWCYINSNRKGSINYVEPTGGGQPHNHGNTGEASNLPPYLSVYIWKRIA